MIITHIILAILWIVYCILHSVLAAARVKQWFRKSSEQYFKYYRLGYTLFATITLIPLIIFLLLISSPRMFSGMGFKIAGVIAGLAGLVIMAVCIRKYFMNLSGIRSLYMENPAGELHISGIHRYIRHPLYLGTFLFIWGLFLYMPFLSLLIVNSIITAYTLIAIRFEEQKLIREFGDDYRRYREKVPMVLPSWRHNP